MARSWKSSRTPNCTRGCSVADATPTLPSFRFNSNGSASATRVLVGESPSDRESAHLTSRAVLTHCAPEDLTSG